MPLLYFPIRLLGVIIPLSSPLEGVGGRRSQGCGGVCDFIAKQSLRLKEREPILAT